MNTFVVISYILLDCYLGIFSLRKSFYYIYIWQVINFYNPLLHIKITSCESHQQLFNILPLVLLIYFKDKCVSLIR